MGLTPAFDIATRAFHAQDLVIRTAGHNLANVNRPGYSRQRVELTTEPPASSGAVILGRGVRVETVRQIVDPLVERQLLQARSASAHASTARDELTRLEQLFAELDGAGLQDALDGFFAAAGDLAVHPQGGPERTVLLGRAESLAARVRDRHANLAELQRQLDDRVAATIPRINEHLDTIARLNGEIFAAEVNDRTANDLRDQRQEALGELATLVGIAHFEAEDGVTVLGPDGILLVEGRRASHLAGDAMPPTLAGLDGRALTRVGFQTTSGAFVPFVDPLEGGELGGFLAARDGDVPAAATSLEQLADALRTAVNAVHANGEDLDGNVGGAFFGGTGAADLSTLITDPRAVAASAITVPPAAQTPEDNTNALALAGLASTALDGTDPAVGNADLGGLTFAAFLASIVADVGTLTESATTRAEAAELLTGQLESQRAAVSGVNTNEELVTLMEAQRAFQAASMLVTTATATLDALLEMAR